MIAGLISARLERALGRRTLLWSAAALMGAGAIGLTAGRTAEVTVGSVLVMGIGGGLLLTTIQAALADHHGERRAVALTETSLAASIAYVVRWRVALLASLAVPVLARWRNRRLAIDAAPPSRLAEGRLPGVFWIAAAMLFCTTAAEWCIAAWGATFVEHNADVSTDAAVALMAGYFAGVVAARTLGSRLARRRDPLRLLALALAATAAGFAILWPARAPAQALVGLSLLGLGLGNPFPMGVSVTVRARARTDGARDRTRGGNDLFGRAARAPHARGARGRDDANGRARGRASRSRTRNGGAHARSSRAHASKRRGRNSSFAILCSVTPSPSQTRM
jgi:predicted MFS family arabinose efflux permease